MEDAQKTIKHKKNGVTLTFPSPHDNNQINNKEHK
jgi:hypothetical protein